MHFRYHAVAGLLLIDARAASDVFVARATSDCDGDGADGSLLRRVAAIPPEDGRVRLEWLRMLRALAYTDRAMTEAAGIGRIARELLRSPSDPSESEAERHAVAELLVLLGNDGEDGRRRASMEAKEHRARPTERFAATLARRRQPGVAEALVP